MATPKSVVRFSKNGITYTSKVDFACYSIVELTRAAMRDVGKFCTRTMNSQAMGLKGLSRSRRVRGYSSAFRYKVPWASSGLPHLEVGVTHGTWYGEQQELGSSGQPKRSIVRNSVHDNIPTIIAIEAQYLSALESEASALRLISEQEYKGSE